jgi:hypothetical protein
MTPVGRIRDNCEGRTDRHQPDYCANHRMSKNPSSPLFNSHLETPHTPKDDENSAKWNLGWRRS